jgi:hypothetical protein
LGRNIQSAKLGKLSVESISHIVTSESANLLFNIFTDFSDLLPDTLVKCVDTLFKSLDLVHHLLHDGGNDRRRPV